MTAETSADDDLREASRHGPLPTQVLPADHGAVAAGAPHLGPRTDAPSHRRSRRRHQTVPQGYRIAETVAVRFLIHSCRYFNMTVFLLDKSITERVC